MRESMKFSNEFAAVIISASGIVGLLVGVAIGLASIIAGSAFAGLSAGVAIGISRNKR